MIVNRINLTRLVSCALLLAFLMAGLNATSALAQDDQEYKRAFNAGLEAYKAKNLTEARSQWVQAAQLAASADPDIAKKSKYYVAQIDYKLGNNAYKAKKFEEALKHYESGYGLYPDYIKNLYGQGLALKQLGRIDEALVKWQEVAANGSDRKTSNTAQQAIRDHFYYQASSAVSKQNASQADADRAITALESSTEYLEPDADYYYYLAVANNIKGQHGQCISNADKALEMHRGSRSDKAKIYFIKGEALMFSGNIPAAKQAFTNAAYGSYKASAEHYLQTL